MKKTLTAILALSLLLAGCSPTLVSEGNSATSARTPEVAEDNATAQDAEAPSIFFSVASVRAVSMLPAPEGVVYLMTGIGQQYSLHHLSPQGDISMLGTVNPDSPALVSSIEPPGLALDVAGNAHFVWVGAEDGLVWYATMEQESGEFSQPVPINQAEGDHHAVMPTLAVNDDNRIAVAWLQGLSMRLALWSDGGEFFAEETINEEVCDCCRPTPHFVDGDLYITFRESQYDEQGRNYRDVHLGRFIDGDFEAWPVADEHWYLGICPVAGPGFVVADDQFFVAWMDGRANQNGGLAQADIWFSTSPVEDVSFSPNLRINQGEGVYNRPPVMVRSVDGRLFVAWIAEDGAQSTIYYSVSTDGGQSFGDPVAVFQSAGPLTAPKSIALAYSGDYLYLAFTDLDGLKLLRIAQ